MNSANTSQNLLPYLPISSSEKKYENHNMASLWPQMSKREACDLISCLFYYFY